MKCPKCQGEMCKVELTGVQVDQCNDCHGVWFDFGELEQTLTREDTRRLTEAVERNRVHDALRSDCPHCGKGKMIRLLIRARPELHIDCCSRCYGQWLDGGELEELKRTGCLPSIADFLKNLI